MGAYMHAQTLVTTAFGVHAWHPLAANFACMYASHHMCPTYMLPWPSLPPHPSPPQPQMLATFGWQCLHSVRSTCSIVDSVGCVASWPLIPIPPMIQAYYNVELGWYLQLMVKQHLGEALRWVVCDTCCV
jgi:hypothetical protein